MPRDPRTDPRPGDVLILGATHRRVTRVNDHVWYQTWSATTATNLEYGLRPRDWRRDMADAVVASVGETT